MLKTRGVWYLENLKVHYKFLYRAKPKGFMMSEGILNGYHRYLGRGLRPDLDYS